METLHYIFLWCGAIVCCIASIGLLRFPNTLSRLHALTKVDNAGLGLIVLGSLLFAENWVEGAKLIFIWVLVLYGSAACSHLIAQHHYRNRSGTPQLPEDPAAEEGRP